MYLALFVAVWFYCTNYQLLYRLYIKQPPSSTSISGYDDEPEWAEYKIKETNMFTLDKYQQVGILAFFALNRFWVHLSAFPWNRFLWSHCFCWISIPTSLQIGFFPKERAFALRYQTAGMLETVLRQGVLGEDDTGEESPK